MILKLAHLRRALVSLVLIASAVSGGGQATAQGVQGCTRCSKAAVIDFDSTQSCQSFSGQWGGVINCNYGWQSFQAMLETAIASSRKMQIVERKQLYNVIDEQKLQSFFRYGGRKWSLGVSAADYLVYGNITEIGFQKSQYREGGYDQSSLVGTFGVDVKFVETRTGKVFYAGSIRVEEQMSGGVSLGAMSSSSSSSAGALYGQLQRKAARAIAAQLVTQAFPIRILRVTGNSAILSYGSGVLERGMRLEVFDGAGGDLVDPDTGRHISGAGFPIATMVVSTVNPDFSVATLTSGSANAMTAGTRVSIVDTAGMPDDRVERGTLP